jgi:hypothetical protein
VGAQGVAGPRGPAGGVAGYERVERRWQLPPGSSAGTYVSCPAGKVVLSGGYVGGPVFRVESSFPVSDTVWLVDITNVDTSTYEMTVWAVCANAA